MEASEFFKRVLLVGLVIVGFILLWYLRDTWLLTFLAIIIAVGVTLPAGWLQDKGMNRGWATLVSALGVTIGGYVIILLLVPPIVKELGTLLNGLPALVQNASEGYEALRVSSEAYEAILPALSELLPSGFEPSDQLIDQLLTLTQNVLSSGLPIVVSGFNAILNLASNLAIVLFVAVFFLVDPVSYVKASLYLVPKHNRPRMVEIWNELYQTIDLWLQAQFSSILITVVLVWAVLGGILNMPNSLTVAVIAGFATFVPNIGAFLPIIPIIIFQLADDPARLVIVLPAYLIIQLLESNVLTPTIVRAELDIPSGALMIFQVVAAFLFGAMGVLLAVPLLAILITLVREIYSFDLLQLRHQPVSLGWNEAGKMVLIERTEDIEATDHSDE